MANETVAEKRAPQVVLRTRGLALTKQSAPLDLEFRSGEITGLSGLEGHGQDEFLRCLCGLVTPCAGHVERVWEDRPPARVTSLQKAARSDIYYLPRERKTQGIFPGLPITDNYAMSALARRPAFGFVRKSTVTAGLEEYREKLCISYPSATSPISSLSGGNQQKVLISRLMACSPAIMLLNDPTRGVDIVTKEALYTFFATLARREGIALVLLSTEVEEILRVCDRALVFHAGRVFCDLKRGEMSRARVVASMFGRDT